MALLRPSTWPLHCLPTSSFALVVASIALTACGQGDDASPNTGTMPGEVSADSPVLADGSAASAVVDGYLDGAARGFADGSAVELAKVMSGEALSRSLDRLQALKTAHLHRVRAYKRTSSVTVVSGGDAGVALTTMVHVGEDVDADSSGRTVAVEFMPETVILSLAFVRSHGGQAAAWLLTGACVGTSAGGATHTLVPLPPASALQRGTNTSSAPTPLVTSGGTPLSGSGARSGSCDLASFPF